MNYVIYVRDHTQKDKGWGCHHGVHLEQPSNQEITCDINVY